jgi:hypothetical protein
MAHVFYGGHEVFKNVSSLEIVEQVKQSSILLNVGSQVLLYVFPQ